MSITTNSAAKPPTADSVINSIAKVYGEQRAEQIWTDLCSELNYPKRNLDVNQLQHIINHMSEQNGALGVVGKSMSVRIMVSKTLS